MFKPMPKFQTNVRSFSIWLFRFCLKFWFGTKNQSAHWKPTQFWGGLYSNFKTHFFFKRVPSNLNFSEHGFNGRGHFQTFEIWKGNWNILSKFIPILTKTASGEQGFKKWADRADFWSVGGTGSPCFPPISWLRRRLKSHTLGYPVPPRLQNVWLTALSFLTRVKCFAAVYANVYGEKI